MPRNIKYVPFIAGFFIFLLIIYFIGIDKLIIQLSKMNPVYYFLAITSVFLFFICWTLRWKLFIKSSGYDISTRKLFENIMIGVTINNITPVAKMGGEPLRAYLLKKDVRMPMEVGLATILADLSIEFFVSIFFVIISIGMATFLIELPAWLFAILMVFLLLSGVVLGGIVGVCSDRNFMIKIIRWLVRKIKRLRPLEDRSMKIYRNFQREFKKSFKNKSLFFKTTFLGSLMRFFDVLKYYLIFISLGYQINTVTVFICIGIGIILMSIPSTPGSLGIAEAGMISSFTLLGVPIQVSTAAVFLERLIWFWGTSALGTLIGLRKGIRLNKGKGLKEYKNNLIK